MPIRDFPFVGISGSIPRPWLPINIVNPHTNLGFFTYGLVDTGADECSVPSSIGDILGHKLTNGTLKKCGTGNGEATAYSHTTKIEIFDHCGKMVYSINETCIDFMIGLPVVLLGVKQFLDNFILNVNYHTKKFSITLP